MLHDTKCFDYDLVDSSIDIELRMLITFFCCYRNLKKADLEFFRNSADHASLAAPSLPICALAHFSVNVFWLLNLLVTTPPLVFNIIHLIIVPALVRSSASSETPVPHLHLPIQLPSIHNCLREVKHPTLISLRFYLASSCSLCTLPSLS